MRTQYSTMDGFYIDEGDMIYWLDTHNDKWNRAIFEIEYRYGELYEIKIGFESGGYTTRYNIADLERIIYKNNPEG